jgi:hypothetical protein
MTDRPRPTPGVCFFPLGDEAVLFDAERQQLHSLNTSAAVIWCLFEEGLDCDGVVETLRHDIGESIADPTAMVAQIVEQWRGLGLLIGGAAPVHRTDTKLREDSPIDAPAVPDTFAFAIERHYRLLDTAFAVRLDDAALDAWIHPVLAHLQCSPQPADVTIDVAKHASGCIIYRDGRAVSRAADGSACAPAVKGLVWQTAINRHRYVLNIHAGVVAEGEDCMLLPGTPGSGKSTLTAALVHAGFAFGSDEVALLGSADMRVTPLPMSLCVKSTGWALVGAMFPELRELRSHHRGDGKIVRYLPPPGKLPEAGWRARWIVFPRYVADADTVLRPIGKIEALQRLLAECVSMPAPLDAEVVRALVGWIGAMACYDLIQSDLDRAVSLIRSAVGGQRSA